LSRRLRRSNKSRHLKLRSRPSKQCCPGLSDSGRVRGECWGPVGPRPSFQETLVRFDHFWTLMGWSKMEHSGEAKIMGSHLFCGPNKGFIRVFVLGFRGCCPMVLPIIRTFCKG
jgi:hypothetical protein